MRNVDAWTETKFTLEHKGLRPSRDPAELAVSSRHTATIAARSYERVIRDHARGRLLDLGCGKVPLYGLYRQYIEDAICVDWPGSAHGNAHIDFAADLNQGLGLRSHSVDTVLSTSVLEHIADPDMFWSELVRVLRPTGKIIVATPFLYCLHEEPHDYARYTKFWYKRRCEMYGLKIVSLEAYGGGVDVALHVAAKMLSRWHLATRLLAAAAPFIAENVLAAQLNIATREVLPAGYCLVAQKL